MKWTNSLKDTANWTLHKMKEKIGIALYLLKKLSLSSQIFLLRKLQAHTIS